MNKIFDYYDLQLRLREPMLGTNASVDIMHEHVINKSREQIKLANAASKKISKSLKKYKGENISQQKEIEELKGILRAQQELLNVKEEIPNALDDILLYSKDVEQRLDNYLQDHELYKSTVFLRDSNGNVGISSHMILGFVKAVLANVINGGDKSILKSKVQMGESMSMDLKFCETFLVASHDIIRDPETKERILNIRPLRFTRMGQIMSALAASEQLPPKTTFSTTLRIRRDSKINDLEVLESIFSHGKNIGLGAFRSSNMFGTFDFKLKKLEDYVELVENSEEGWM